MERHWSGVQEWLGELLIERGVDRISAEELTVPPGRDELFALLRLQTHHESGEWDVIIVDCAPTGETLRLLSFPDVARWWIEKVFPFERQILAAARPIARSLLDISLPEPGGVRRHRAAVAEPHRDERDPPRPHPVHDPAGDEPGPDGDRGGDAHVHLPQPVRVSHRRGDRQPPVPRGRRATTSTAWRRVQEEHLELRALGVRAGAGAVRAVSSSRRWWGPGCSTACGPSCSPTRTRRRCCTTRWPRSWRCSTTGPGCGWTCPFAEKGDISLKKIGLELVVGVDGQRRTIMLPPAMAAMRPAAATFEDGALEIRFDGGR